MKRFRQMLEILHPYSEVMFAKYFCQIPPLHI
jgi:hypothetical protein